jgi:hypothetical protein
MNQPGRLSEKVSFNTINRKTGNRKGPPKVAQRISRRAISIILHTGLKKL